VSFQLFGQKQPKHELPISEFDHVSSTGNKELIQGFDVRTCRKKGLIQNLGLNGIILSVTKFDKGSFCSQTFTVIE